MPNIKFVLVKIFAPVLVVVGLYQTVSAYSVYRAVSDHGRLAPGVIERVDKNSRRPENAWRVTYTFRKPDNGVVRSSVSLSRQAAERYRPGQKLDIVYDPSNPAANALSNEQAWETTRGYATLAAVFSAAFLCLFVFAPLRFGRFRI